MMNSIYKYLTGFPVLVMLFTNLMFVLVVQAGGKGVAHYTGQIDKEKNSKFFNDIKGIEVNRLVITSSGGEVEAAIKLGSWVFENKIDVEVQEYCLSSCANYIFPAGHSKQINKGAIVAWHGNYHHLKVTGLWKEEVDGKVQLHGLDRKFASEQVLAQVNRLVQMERKFFKYIGIDEFICWAGKMPPYNVPDYYFLSRQDMNLFGINNLNMPDDYEHTDVSDFTVSIAFIRLH